MGATMLGDVASGFWCGIGPVGASLLAMAPILALHFLDGMHIHSCGNGGWRFRPYGGSLLANAPKVTKRSRPWRTAFAALRFPRSGVHQGASTPVGFASTSIRCPRLRRGALRACPLMNASTRPPDGAGRSRSKAKAAPCATYRSALTPVAAAEPARLRSTAQQAQDLETAGGPAVLSQPAAAATGLGRHQGRVGQIWFC
ncbi:hypothetical protein SAMN03159489_03918 [Pseudomonas sp. NFPP07]|nr:hypothetical protein SAMN03159489_03918 [Pseudomonas sp. NFPP07]